MANRLWLILGVGALLLAGCGGPKEEPVDPAVEARKSAAFEGSDAKSEKAPAEAGTVSD